MRSLRMSLLAVSAATLLAMPAFAQPPGGGGRGGRGGMMQMGRGMSIGMLLGNPGVQEELKLTDEQKGKIKDFAAKQREAQQGLRDLDPEEQRSKRQELTKHAETFAKDVLSADQQKRIKQISIQTAAQMGGAAVFAMEEVAKQVKLTDEQKEKFKTLGEDFRNDVRELFQGGGDMQENMQKSRSLAKEYLGKATAALTDEQKKAWSDLTGKPFEVKFEMRQRQDR